MVNNKLSLLAMNHKHYKLYKPYGYLSQFKYELSTRKNKKTLGDFHDFPEGIMSVGRLDEDSEGLLLLTTDGKFSNDIRSKKVEKEYVVQVDGVITKEAIEKLCEGVEISINGSKYTTLPCKAYLIEEEPIFPPRAKPVRDDRHGPSTWAGIIVKEGKFRQVKKMTAAVGFPTLRLIRIRVGEYHLGNMIPGEVEEL
jgi:23S rRNA pseudouridine2457 synthase